MIQLHLQKKWVQGFFNESLQTAFSNNGLNFMMNAAKVNIPSERARKRGAESAELINI